MNAAIVALKTLIFPVCCFICHTGDYAETYRNIIPCLQNSRHMNQKVNLNSLSFPKDAENHYRELLNATQAYRTVLHHEGPANYRGPWIENHFIAHFMGKNLSYFNGFIPLFIQWTDIHVADSDLDNPYYNGTFIPNLKDMQDKVLKLLRHDVIYLAVSQDDRGLFLAVIGQRPNILVLSAGGFGHIPIPLIKGELSPIAAPSKYQWDVGFFGSIRPRLSRSVMLSQVEIQLKQNKLKYSIGPSNEWIQSMADSKFNLAPRGYGRTSYRLAEIIQIGRVPVYMYDDNEWLPYAGTDLALSNYGFSAKIHNFQAIISNLSSCSQDRFDEMMSTVIKVREHYTYSGVLKQIEYFIRDPFGSMGGQLRCTRVPDKEH